MIKPAQDNADPIGQQLKALIDAHKKDYSQMAVLQQIIQFGMAHERYDVVEQHLASFIQMGAEAPALYHVIATVQEKQGNYEKAAASIRALFRLNGEKTEVMYEAAGKILPHTFQVSDLELCCNLLEAGTRQYPANLEIIHYLVEAYQMLGEHGKAVRLYEDAVKRMPHTHVLYFTLALVKLISSNLKEGYDAYKHRFELPSFKAETPFCPWAEWRGEPLQGKKIFIWAEQGVGDMVMWAGLLPWLVEQGAKITCAVPAKLEALFARSFPGITVVRKQLVLPQELLMADFDYHSPLGNLMEYVLPHYTPAKHAAYLLADKDAVAKKRAEYLALNPKATKVIGVSWQSQAVTGWRRNIPLENWHSLLNDPQAVYVSLQYNQRLDDVDAYNSKNEHKLHIDYAFAAMMDVDSWATQLAAMDEVFSIQNSTVHLAGALGVPTTIFLPTYGSFHWGDAKGANPWYKTVTICQQKLGQKWKSLIKESIRN